MVLGLVELLIVVLFVVIIVALFGMARRPRNAERSSSSGSFWKALLSKPATLECWHCGQTTTAGKEICDHCGKELQ